MPPLNPRHRTGSNSTPHDSRITGLWLRSLAAFLAGPPFLPCHRGPRTPASWNIPFMSPEKPGAWELGRVFYVHSLLPPRRQASGPSKPAFSPRMQPASDFTPPKDLQSSAGEVVSPVCRTDHVKDTGGTPSLSNADPPLSSPPRALTEYLRGQRLGEPRPPYNVQAKRRRKRKSKSRAKAKQKQIV